MLSPPQPLDLKPFNLSTPIPIEASPALFFLCPAKAVLESDVWSRTRSLAACLPKISQVGSYSRSCDLDLERRVVDILSGGDMFDQPRVTPHLIISIFLGFIENVKVALSTCSNRYWEWVCKTPEQRWVKNEYIIYWKIIQIIKENILALSLHFVVKSSFF